MSAWPYLQHNPAGLVLLAAAAVMISGNLIRVFCGKGMSEDVNLLSLIFIQLFILLATAEGAM